MVQLSHSEAHVFSAAGEVERHGDRRRGGMNGEWFQQ